MADKKITELSALTGATTVSTDPLVIVDLDVNETKKITLGELYKGVPAGTVGAPAIAPQDDQNTGIYFPAADTMAFVEGGAETMRIDSSGNVGINVTTPSGKLDINGTTALRGAAVFNTLGIVSGTGSSAYVRANNAFSTASTPDYTFWFNDTCGIFHPAGNVIAFSAAAAETMRIDSTGNVGVGISAPARRLEVYDSASSMLAQFRSASGTSSFICFANTTSTADAVRVGSTETSLVLSTAFTERARIDASGNVGIGTTTPATFGKLAVAGNTVPTVDNSYSLGTATYKWSNVYATTFTENGYNLVSQTDLGTNANEIPLNQYLGALAYKNTVGLQATANVAPTVASASSIQPQAPIVFVSGTTTINTIVVPLEFIGGGQITLIPTGLWSTGTSGNIAIATTGVVSKALIMTYDAATTKWYPSY